MCYTMKSKKLIWIVLFEDFEVDGRVQRQIKALSDDYDVLVYSVTSKDIRSNYLNSRFIKIGSTTGFVRSLIELLKYVTFTKEKPDLVIFNNIYTIPALILFKLFFRKSKLIYDSHELIVPDPITKHSIASRKSIFLERIGVKLSDLVFCTNEKRSDLMQQYYDLPKRPTSIENFVDIEPCNKYDEKNHKKYHKDKVKFLYQGVLKEGRYLYELVEAFSACKKSELHIYGFGAIEKELISLSSNNDSLNKSVFFHGKMSREQLYTNTRSYDVGLVVYDFSNMNNKYCSPNKTSEYVLSGLPILCTPQESLIELIDSYRIGAYFPLELLELGKKTELAQFIDEFCDSVDDYNKNVFSSRKYLDFNSQSKKIKNVVTSLLGTDK